MSNSEHSIENPIDLAESLAVDAHVMGVARQLGQLSVPGATIEDRVEAGVELLSDGMLRRYDIFVSDNYLLARTAGQTPLIAREVVGSLLHNFVTVETRGLPRSPADSQIMSLVPEGQLLLNYASYYRKIKASPAYEESFRNRFQQVAFGFARRYPQVYVADALRRKLVTDKRPIAHSDALRDLNVIYGMTISGYEKAKQLRKQQDES